MKKLLVLVLLLTSATGFAETREILCQEKPHTSDGAFGFTLDNSKLNSGGSYFQVGLSSFAFSYSSATLICSKKIINFSAKESFSCVGHNSAGGLTEISVTLQNGVGTAKVHNLGEGAVDNVYNDQTEGMILPCRLKK